MMKFNINKIHGNLLSIKEMGDSVSISEKSDKKHGSHFEIVAEMQGKQLKMIVRKNALESDSFEWHTMPILQTRTLTSSREYLLRIRYPSIYWTYSRRIGSTKNISQK